jgi:hypothetical protein
MPKRARSKALLAAVNAGAYGADALPTEAMRAYDFSVTPMEATAIEDDAVQPYLGAGDTYLAGRHARLSFAIRAVGAGAAGTVPPFGDLLRMCGLSEVVTAATDVTYEPVSTGFEDGTLYYLQDGKLRSLTGCRGTVTFTAESKAVPFLKFEMMGLYVPPSEVAMPAVDWSSWQTPLPAQPSNTAALSVHGYAPILSRLVLGLGQSPEFVARVNQERIDIAKRAGTGEAVIEEPALVDKDYEAAVAAHTKGPVLFRHGTVPGNIVEVSAPKAQITGITESESEGVAMQTLQLSLKPDAGDDEMKIVFK